MHQRCQCRRGIAVGNALGLHAGLVLVQHQGGNALQGLLAQRLEGDDLIHAAQKLGAEELAQCLAALLLVSLLLAAVEAQTCGGLVAAARIGGHADDGVGEIHGAALGIVDLALVQDLQQDIHHIGMGLFDLIEQHHAVRAAADLFGQLTRLLVAHIARRGTDHAGHSVLFHILAHIQPDQRIGAVKELVCQLLHQLRLAHAGGAHKDKAGRTAAAREVGAAALDRLCHQMHGIVLTDDLLFQLGLKAGELCILGLPDLHRRDARPQLNDLGHIVHGHLDLPGRGLLGGQFPLQLRHPGLALCHTLVIDGLVHIGVFHVGLFLLESLQFLLHGQVLGDDRVGQITAGTGLVQQVDGLVGQIAVGDIPLAQGHGGVQHIGGHLHMVVLLVVMLDAAHHGQRISDAGFLHPHGLEPALQRLVLLDILAVLVEGGGTDDLDLAAGEGGLQDIARIHGTLALTGRGNGVDLVNEQDDVARRLDLAQQALDPLLELAAELGTCHKAGQVEQEDLLILQPCRYLPLGNALGNALGNGGLANARLTNEAGVVLLAAAQDLDGAVDLPVAADDIIQLPLPGFAGQILAVGIQKLAAGRLFVVFARLLFVFAVLGTAVHPQREGGAGAGHKVAVLFALVRLAHAHHHGEGVHVAHVPHLLHHVFHPVFHGIHVLVGHAELLHQIIDRLDVHLPGTVQAVPLVFHLAIFHPLDKNNGRPLLASNADHCSSFSLPAQTNGLNTLNTL